MSNAAHKLFEMNPELNILLLYKRKNSVSSQYFIQRENRPKLLISWGGFSDDIERQRIQKKKLRQKLRLMSFLFIRRENFKQNFRPDENLSV